MAEKIIYTVGTSNRSLEEFIDILKTYKIKTLIDVRSYPGSKKFPHFNKENLEEILKKEGFEYIHLGKELGGFRKGGYEAHMKTEDFKRGIEKVEEIAMKDTAVFFCAEKLFFRCHRRFIADVLSEKSWRVFHIVEKGIVKEHKTINASQKLRF